MGTTIFSPRDRIRLDRAADHYLRTCYRSRTAARVTEFATFLDLTQPYLSRLVSSIIGLSVRDYLRRRQLTYAEYLLHAAPNLSVRQIGIASAFGTGSTFHRCFKAAYGNSPGAYRKVTKCDNPKRFAPLRGITSMPFYKVMKCE